MFVQGQCATFAPPNEARTRRLHRCEEGSPAWPVIKSFSRSAAGSEVRAEDVRPEHVLCGAVDHLLGAVLTRPDMALRDGFISDCLRAARVDGSVQRLRSARWAHALLRMARYHVAAGYLMSELRVAGEAGGLDAVGNDARCGEALGDAAGVVAALGGGAPPALAAEVHALCLLRALAAPPEAATVIVALATRQLRACGGTGAAAAAAAAAAARWRLALAPALAWLGGRWGEFLRRAGALPPGEPLFRAALHPLLPLARARLLAALNEAVPRALPFPVAAAERALAFTGGSRSALGGGEGGGGEGSGGGGGLTVEDEPPWFRAARFAAQLRVEVRLGGEGGGQPAAAEDLFSLLREWRAVPRAGAAGEAGERVRAAVAALALHFNKAAPLPARPEEAAAADVKLRVALCPLREDAFLGAAAGCSTAGGLEPFINAPLEAA
jgi:hypothetical protein